MMLQCLRNGSLRQDARPFSEGLIIERDDPKHRRKLVHRIVTTKRRQADEVAKLHHQGFARPIICDVQEKIHKCW